MNAGRLRRSTTALFFAVLLALTAACASGEVQRKDSGDQAGYVSGTGVVTTIAPDERADAPEFEGPTLDGDTFNLDDAAGDVVVLNVWGSWCPPCRKEAPAMQAVATGLADQGVQFVGVNTRDTESGANAFVEEFGLSFPSVVDTDGVRLLAFRDTLPPAAIPSTLVVDRQGRVAARVIGPITETSLRDLVAEVAAEPA